MWTVGFVLLAGLWVGSPATPLMVTQHLLRARDVLDGTVLTVQGPFRTRSADLAVAGSGARSAT